MESVELYRQLLGLTAPWTVERVELDIAKQRVPPLKKWSLLESRGGSATTP